jgi:hypothetical protein
MGAMDSWWPAAAIADADQAISNAREMGQAVTLMHALGHAAFTYLHCGNYAIANLQSEEAIALSNAPRHFWSQACAAHLQTQAASAYIEDHESAFLNPLTWDERASRREVCVRALVRLTQHATTAARSTA